jgi:AcrR family transcriptional regulator
MSGNAAKEDRRIRRTRDALGDALMALVQEKPFESITVQDVLDRAGVGRSTFYAHYKGKDDLLLTDAEEFFEFMSTLLERTGERPGRVAPVREFFAHVAEVRRFYDALLASGRGEELLELGRGQFARAIEKRLPQTEDRTALAQALAGALFSLLAFWVRRGMPGSPAEMDALFHRLVHP